MRARPDPQLFADVPEARRRIMRAIRSQDTTPEASVRSRLHRLGYRFRKNLTSLPGRPDVAFTRRRKAVFIHGCFWHSHQGCTNSRVPRTRVEYWTTKLARTVERDHAQQVALRSLGWDVKVIWECEVRRGNGWEQELRTFLGCACET